MIKHRLLLFCLLFLIVQQTLAQSRTITGQVTNDRGEPLPGASVNVKGRSAGTAAGIDGKFSLTVPSNDAVLTVSFSGYQPDEVVVGKDNDIVIKLSQQPKALNEVVVVGYGTARKRDLTGSVTLISTKDFQKGIITTPDQLIAGKVAGVQITSNGGAPGAGSSIRIRGGASLSASNDPLIVIDGMPLDNGTISGAPNPLSLINPNDIESFNILKDASSTAIYGSRASNGVIIITTKRGRRGKMVVNVSSQNSASVATKFVDVLSAGQLRDLLNKQTNSAPKALLGTANTDWQDVIYHTALTSDNNVSVSGAVGKTPYRVSAGYIGQGGILRTGFVHRASGSINVNPSLFTDHLKINISLKGTSSRNRFANQDAIGAAIAFDPTHPVYSGNQRFRGYYQWVDPSTNKPNVQAPENPLGLLETKLDKSNVKRSIGNIQFDYSLHFMPELHANLNLGYDISRGTGTVFIPDSAATGRTYARGGQNTQYFQQKLSKLMEAYLSYTKEVPSIKSRFDVVGGYSYQDFLTTDSAYADYNAAGVKIPNSDPLFRYNKPQNTLISFYGRLNYSLLGRYLLTGSIRRDGSSRFGEENRWGWFPAAALAWRIKEEEFLKSSGLFSDLKLRLGFGITGQQDIGLNYSYLGTYALSTSTAQYQFGNQFYYMYRPAGYNPNLKWEETRTYNAGLDFGFLNNRINGTLDVYYKKTTDLLNNINQPAGANFSNVILANIGSMVNRGIELNLNAVPVRNNTYTWDVNFNITYNRNKITQLTAVNDPNYPGVQFGGVSGGINNNIQINSVGYNRGAFYVYKQVYDAAGKPLEGVYADQNGDGIINEKDLYRYKNADPKLFLGFSTNLSYQKWNAGFTMRGNIGNYIYNNVWSNTGRFSAIYTLPNILSNASTDYLTTGFQNNQVLSDYYIQNGSFVRMDNVFVGYNLGRLFRSFNMSLTGSVQNVFVITDYKGIDPEISDGIDKNFYPRPRIYALGINLNF